MRKPANKTFACLLLLAGLTFSCTSNIEINGFSSEKWKSDRNGCMDLRQEYSHMLLGSRDKILGKSEHAVLSLLGRPDKNELYRRQQKFYIYYLEPGPACDSSLAQDSISYLSIRFNATGIAKEFFIYEK